MLQRCTYMYILYRGLSVNTELSQSTVHGLDYGLWTIHWLREQIWIQTTPTSYYDLLPRPLPVIILCHAHFLVS